MSQKDWLKGPQALKHWYNKVAGPDTWFYWLQTPQTSPARLHHQHYCRQWEIRCRWHREMPIIDVFYGLGRFSFRCFGLGILRFFFVIHWCLGWLSFSRDPRTHEELGGANTDPEERNEMPQNLKRVPLLVALLVGEKKGTVVVTVFGEPGVAAIRLRSRAPLRALARFK